MYLAESVPVAFKGNWPEKGAFSLRIAMDFRKTLRFADLKKSGWLCE